MSNSVRRRFSPLFASVLAGGLLAGCVSSANQNATSDSGSPGAQDSAAIALPTARPTAVHSGYAVIITPSKNISCEFSDTTAGCGVMNYMNSKPYGSDELGPKWWVRMKNSASADQAKPEIVSRSEPPLSQKPETSGQQVEYGTVVYHGDYVCASEDAGLTCWNTTTGHGAFMNRDATTTF